MGPGIVIPVVLVVVIVPVAFVWARRTFKEGAGAAVEVVPPPSARLTSNALRELPTPPWRVVYEIAADKLGGVEHVAIGPAGIYAMQTSMDPLPAAPVGDPDPKAVGRAAVTRGALDDALRRCAMSSTAPKPSRFMNCWVGAESPLYCTLCATFCRGSVMPR